MPKLSSETVTIMDGDIRLTRRPNSRAWQAAFKAGKRLVRISTGCRQLDDAKRRAREQYMEYQLRLKNNLPTVTKRFADVAATCIADMQNQLAAGTGKKSYKDYIAVLKRYFIPYFQNQHVNKITFADLQAFSKWRVEKIGKEPKASTLNTHNAAIARVFDEAVAQGYIHRSHVPLLINKGKDSERRPDFDKDEYRKLLGHLPHWINAGRKGKSRDMRHLLRDYILILANTGIRHGTEADNLHWKHVNLFTDKGKTFLEMSVDGKTGRRDIICRSGTENYLKRIQSRCADIAGFPFEELLKRKIDKPVFRLPDGTTTMNLRQTFRRLMEDTDLLKCPRTERNRTLYSLRHTYATFGLVNDGLDIHTLAIQMGTSIQMIEQHYSHLTPRLKKEALTGKRYELTAEEYRQKQAISGMEIDPAELNKAVTDDDDVDDALPAEPDEGDAEAGSESVSLPNEASAADNGSKSSAEMAFDLFEDGRLSENGLIAALGVDKPGFELSERLRQRALQAFGQGKLTGNGLLRLMGHQQTDQSSSTASVS
ncbi:tyrosine-type recombinase/integrase [Saliniramus fredricksonii]|uniref:Site-specific recombinase XerD n=2 Tax=Saliniramus fredricksonii TaxID=1653334 RepID=A0ABY0K4N6_9HYPH|nr:site-specific integrase [Saliniramus fredricksonii]SCC78520.1 Site-specific recombinase XerD [Saliniramus fredricksonii]